MGVLVGKPAPDFTVPAVLGDGSIVDEFTLSEAIKGKYGLVFFYPLDFTFVCPSELIALDHRMDAFKERDAHSALYDATRTAELFCSMVNRFRDLGGWPPPPAGEMPPTLARALD